MFLIAEITDKDNAPRIRRELKKNRVQLQRHPARMGKKLHDTTRGTY